jgi:hypothetical protein
MYFLGYQTPTSYGAFRAFERRDWGAHSEHAATEYCGAPPTKISHKTHCARGKAVDKQLAEASDAGCHGMSLIVKKLKYCDYNDTFVVPIAHAGLCGVVKDFWYQLLKTPARGQPAPCYVLSNEAKRVIASRESHLTPTCDFGRRYTDIISKKGNWTMEDWLHWTEAWSVYVLMPNNGVPLLHPDVQQMWQHLRAGLLYYCRSVPNADVAQSAADATAELKAYACLVQEKFGKSMCKFNLHLLVCRLADQEAARGNVAHSTEYWVENLIQWAKSTVRYRTTKYPELLLCSDMLVDDALARCTAATPGVRKCVDEWAHGDAEGVCFTSPDMGGEDGTQLLGPGKELCAADRTAADVAVAGYVSKWQPASWSADQVPAAEMLLYTYADVRGVEILHSVRYTKARTRVSYNVFCQYHEAGAAENAAPTNYVGHVQYFVMVLPPAGCDGQPLRLAITNLHKLETVNGGAGVLYQAPTYPADPSHTRYAVHMHMDEHGAAAMHDKLVMACSGTGAFFMPYSNMSASARED